MGDLLSVGIGGFLGAVLRFGLSGATERWTELTGFPIGTLGANLLGCFAIGLFAAYADQRDLWQSSLRLFVVVGVLGGFTTFSAFGYESFALLRAGHAGTAVINAAAQLVVGIGAVWLGYTLLAVR